MARLKYIKGIKDTSLLRLGISEGEETVAYTVTQTVYSALGRPAVDSELDTYAMDEIHLADETRRAEKKALSLLAFSDNSERALVRKLCERGFRRSVAEEIGREMVGLGYVREDDQIRRLALSLANTSQRGPMKIIPYLVGKGYSSGDVKRVLTELQHDGEIDFDLVKERILKKHGVDPENIEDVRRLLYKYGFKV